MCAPLAIPVAMMAMAAAQGAMSAKDQAKQAGAAIDQQRKQKAEMIKQMNISNANSDLQTKQDLQDSFVQASDINLQGVHNEGIVRAAIGESMLSGHSMDRIMTDITGEEARASAQNSESYSRKYQNNFIDKMSNYEQTKANITGMAPIATPNKLATALNVVSGVAKAGASSYAGMKAGGDTTSGQVMGGLKGGLGGS